MKFGWFLDFYKKKGKAENWRIIRRRVDPFMSKGYSIFLFSFTEKTFDMIHEKKIRQHNPIICIWLPRDEFKPNRQETPNKCSTSWNRSATSSCTHLLSSWKNKKQMND
jgi:hypothetical protein